VAGLGDAELHAVGDAGGHVDGDRPDGSHAPLPRALLARIGDLQPRAAADHALAGGHQLAEDAPPDLLDHPAAAAGATGDGRAARLRAVAEATRAHLEGIDLDLAVRAEGGLLELQRHRDVDVLAALDPAAGTPATGGAEPPAAEEHVEDVLDVAERRAPQSDSLPEGVVLLATAGVREDLIGAGDLLEALLGVGRAVHIRMELPRELAIGALDVLG
jgi:hypothetical protein